MEITLAPPYSIILIHDPTHPVEVPQSVGTGLVAATDTCIAVGTLAEMDGETTIRLASSYEHPEGEIVFEGMVNTPGCVLAINTAERDGLIQMPVGQRARVTVWANDAQEPDLILVAAR